MRILLSNPEEETDNTRERLRAVAPIPVGLDRGGGSLGRCRGSPALVARPAFAKSHRQTPRAERSARHNLSCVIERISSIGCLSLTAGLIQIDRVPLAPGCAIRGARSQCSQYCSTRNPGPTCVFSMLFLMFPVFLVVEYMAIRRARRPHGSWQAIQNTENTKNSLGCDWEHAGNKAGNTRNIFISAYLSIPPVQPVPLTLPVPQPTLGSQTTSGTNLVCLCPLRLRLVNALLQDLGNCRGLPAL